jgi:WD40 repeat protein
MSESKAPPWLFLSHSGADTEAARDLKRRLLDSADARETGLRVWLDKDDLAAGTGWQGQLEKVITEQSTAFAVHVGAKGIVNWVESEVRLGLSRATTASNYPFIPVLAKECSGSAALPPFARQFEAVRDPLNKPDELVKLLRAVLRRSADEKTIVLDSPFVGLKAMTEADADRFFGRNEEIAEIIAKLKQHRLIAIVADSGAGKSSLAQAGLIPAFRGGALADTGGREPDDRLWHVVVMRPRRDPMEGLRRGVTEAAERLGRSAEECAALRKRIQVGDPSEAAYAIRCDLPVAKTQTLLVVDQFEELLTETGEGQRGPYVDLLMALEAAGGFWIVLTLRVDHFNLCRPLVALFQHLTRDNQDTVLRLRRITDAGIAEAVRNPLRLAGHTDAVEQDALIASIRRDITDRAGDLALVQMALYAMWQNYRAERVDLLVAYAKVGGVVGALAHEAEHVRTHRLDATERALLASLFIRLVRLGETSGATRRAADLNDFDGPRRVLVAKLATEDCGRLLLAGERTVEIAHEALITQWPWLQNALNEAAVDMRLLDRLMDKARRWNTTGSRSAEHLATGAERVEFAVLADHRRDWLSTVEREFVGATQEAHALEEHRIRDERERKQRLTDRLGWMTKGLAATAVVLIVALITAVLLWHGAQSAKEASRVAEQDARAQRDGLLLFQSRFLANRASQYSREGDAGTAMLLALEALPDISGGVERPLAQEAETALFEAYQGMRELVILKAHKGSVWSATFSADGRRIVTASDDNTARVWDGDDGHQLALLGEHTEPVRVAAFSPDGRHVITVSADNMARVWEANTGKQLSLLAGHRDLVRSAVFSSDGRYVVTGSDDNTARIWETATGNQTAVFQGHDGPVRSAVFSPDGQHLLTASDDTTARLWDTKTEKLVALLEGHTEPVRFAAFSPDGRLAVTTSEDNTARLWKVETGKQLVLLQGHNGVVWRAVFSPDGEQVVTASDDNTARVWDTRTGEQAAVLANHTGPVKDVAFSADGRLVVTASDDHTSRMWEARTGKQTAVLEGHRGPVHRATFSPDGRRVLTASRDGTARLWRTNTAIIVLHGHRSAVHAAAFSPDGRRVVTGSDDNTARVWDARSGKQIAQLEGHHGPVRTAVFSPDGQRVLTASYDGTARLWNIDENKHVALLKGHTAAVRSAAFSSNGGRIATASDDNTARIWNSDTGKQMALLEGHTKPVTSVAFSPDGQLVVTASDDNTARIWTAPAGKQTAVLRHAGPVNSAIFSPDGRHVVTASWDGTARLWNAQSGDSTARLEGHGAQVYSASFSPDGRYVITTSSDETARLWEVETGKQFGVLEGHSGSVWSAAFSPDGRQVITISADETARLWKVGTGKEFAVLSGHTGAVFGAGFSSDGARVITAGADNTARIWPIFPELQLLVERSKQIVPRCLTQQQRNEAFLEKEPPTPTWCIENGKWPYHSAEWEEWLKGKLGGANLPPPPLR